MDKKSPVFNYQTGDFETAQGDVQTVTGAQAFADAIVKAEVTPRGRYLIYADNERPEYNHIYGSDAYNVLKADLNEEARISEIERTVGEAIKYDPDITDVSNIVVAREGTDSVKVSLQLETTFDTLTIEGVTINE